MEHHDTAFPEYELGSTTDSSREKSELITDDCLNGESLNMVKIDKGKYKSGKPERIIIWAKISHDKH